MIRSALQETITDFPLSKFRATSLSSKVSGSLSMFAQTTVNSLGSSQPLSILLRVESNLETEVVTAVRVALTASAGIERIAASNSEFRVCLFGLSLMRRAFGILPSSDSLPESSEKRRFLAYLPPTVSNSSIDAMCFTLSFGVKELLGAACGAGFYAFLGFSCFGRDISTFLNSSSSEDSS